MQSKRHSQKKVHAKIFTNKVTRKEREPLSAAIRISKRQEALGTRLGIQNNAKNHCSEEFGISFKTQARDYNPIRHFCKKLFCSKNITS